MFILQIFVGVRLFLGLAAPRSGWNWFLHVGFLVGFFFFFNFAFSLISALKGGKAKANRKWLLMGLKSKSWRPCLAPIGPPHTSPFEALHYVLLYCRFGYETLSHVFYKNDSSPSKLVLNGATLTKTCTSKWVLLTMLPVVNLQ